MFFKKKYFELEYIFKKKLLKSYPLKYLLGDWFVIEGPLRKNTFGRSAHKQVQARRYTPKLPSRELRHSDMA
jgi:hypothetical protein